MHPIDTLQTWYCQTTRKLRPQKTRTKAVYGSCYADSICLSYFVRRIGDKIFFWIVTSVTAKVQARGISHTRRGSQIFLFRRVADTIASLPLCASHAPTPVCPPLSPIPRDTVVWLIGCCREASLGTCRAVVVVGVVVLVRAACARGALF